MNNLRLFTLILTVLLLPRFATPQSLHKLNIVYPNGGPSWPLFVAKEAGYFRKYGLDANLVFGVHPTGVAMVVSGEAQANIYALEPLMIAVSRDQTLVLVSGPINRGAFALMTKKDILSVSDLKGKRLAVGQIGDANYSYSTVVLRQAGLTARDVEWIPLGPDTTSRVSALTSGRIDAVLLTAPAYFKLEAAGFRNLVNFAERQDLFASAALVMKRSVVAADRALPGEIIKAEAEGVKRFYEDKAFAVKVFMQYDRTTPQSDAEKLYDLYAKSEAFERIPLVQTRAVTAAIDQEPDETIASRLRGYNFRTTIDNSFIERLMAEGFFEQLFGPGIKNEELRMEKSAFNAHH